ncbi:MAG TPA: undecaprenyl-diphosphate phosphatase [Steroidobacteraceae bacterium]|nr:undecaprenyl-diphosphate phosphatase [Steroidobacteraceae bacterium]HNS27632.1 undecaprenyl-diphosphate phosphatase [Steroidobacteraceae bacterium]
MEISAFAALVLGIVEGLTEFLPISSTGHLIITSSLLDLHGPKVLAFEIIIQGAAILAVCWEYRRLLWKTTVSIARDAGAQRFALNIFLGFLPLAVLGLAFQAQIEEFLFRPVPVAIALVIGGIAILWVDRRHGAQPTLDTVEAVPVRTAIVLGLWQALALIPGTSRAGATIIGGVWLGMSRRLATEYSFFLAIPTLIGATVYKLYEGRDLFIAADLVPFTIGAVVAFITALLAVRGFIRFISTHSFAAFGWYRIVFGVIVLLIPW